MDEMNDQIQNQETEQPEPVEETTQEAPQEQPEQEQQQSEADRNFRELRTKTKQVEKERDELKRYIEDLQRQQQSLEQKNATQEDPDPQLAPDDLVEWKYVDKKIKSLEKKLDEQHKVTHSATVETKLRNKYVDFDQVVNKDNIEHLRDQYPELAQSLAANNDLYSQSVAVYTAIKKLGIVTDSSYDANKTKAQENASKPRPLASVNSQQGDSPLSKANEFSQGLTPELKKKLWQEMVEISKRR